MKPHILAPLTLLLLILLAACAGRATPTPAPEPTATLATTTTLAPPTPTAPAPTAALAPTATPEPAAQGNCPAPAPTPTPFALPAEQVSQACVTIADSLPADLRPGGALLLTDAQQAGSIYHLDLMSWRKSPFPNAYYYTASFLNPGRNQYIALSPDGKWLAYLEVGHDARGSQKDLVLKVANAEGRYLDMSYWTLNWQYLIGWQDNQHLLLAVPSYPGRLIRLNPFTTQYEFIEVALPDLRPEAFADPERVLGSPDLSHWLYLPDQEHAGWRLVNRDGSRLLWEEQPYFYSSDPAWSPNGQYFTSLEDYTHRDDQASTGRLLRVKLDGQAAPLTPALGKQPVLAWSPDGRYLAGWLELDPQAKGYGTANHLVLLDVEKPLYIDLCFENQTLKAYGSSTNYIENVPPVWSPDGRFLAIRVSHIVKDRWGYDKIIWDTALIDLQTYRGYKLIDNYYPWLWMRKPGAN